MAGGKEIVLFGKGEERRDHVLIDDVAEVKTNRQNKPRSETGLLVDEALVLEKIPGAVDKGYDYVHHS